MAGANVGFLDGVPVGVWLGYLDGVRLGLAVDVFEGARLGEVVAVRVGDVEGDFEGKEGGEPHLKGSHTGPHGPSMNSSLILAQALASS